MPLSLGPNVNSRGLDFNCFIDPDEKYLIYSSYERSDDIGKGNLYISENKNVEWQPSLNLGHAINSSALDYSPFVSHGKKYFFFTSLRSIFRFPFSGPSTLNEIHKILHSYGNRSEYIYIFKCRFPG